MFFCGKTFLGETLILTLKERTCIDTKKSFQKNSFRRKAFRVNGKTYPADAARLLHGCGSVRNHYHRPMQPVFFFWVWICCGASRVDRRDVIDDEYDVMDGQHDVMGDRYDVTGSIHDVVMLDMTSFRTMEKESLSPALLHGRQQHAVDPPELARPACVREVCGCVKEIERECVCT